ncbi:low specificity L-threonine aldolase [Salinibacterium sp. SYSU T00001]|uniref:threonine aldolase family protein n=1 Tax=Homoserinimonas sedimenticola TaxID=2986805 RepID=UPI002235C126|nr:low specificity L-threonine aldolase [Salinibacterium sedimenticola]MCW4385586.1 low specificity L-threonine aldolase [Salinibacterium sedimenticola]
MRLHDPQERHFASDNYAGVHPELLAAIAEANGGHQSSYGADAYTARLQEVVREHFGETAEALPVFNGTGANVVALTSMLPRWGAVITAGTAHINTDENAAPERVSGIKLLTVDTPDGKLTPELIDRHTGGRGDEHRAQPLVVSVTQATELGTVYTPEELRAVSDHAHSLGMRVHLDGARLANAAASLDVPLRALTMDAGIDVVSFGGTKNGLLFGEAVVVLDPAASVGLPFIRKYTMQLPSKMRFVSAQLVALLEGDLWLRSARHANEMAARLRGRLEGSVTFTQPSDANALFAILPVDAAARLRERHHFYDWDAARGEVRWMTAFDTTEADVDTFADDVLAAIGAR